VCPPPPLPRGQLVLRQLRWMLQKDALGQDMFLVAQGRLSARVTGGPTAGTRHSVHQCPRMVRIPRAVSRFPEAWPSVYIDPTQGVGGRHGSGKPSALPPAPPVPSVGGSPSGTATSPAARSSTSASPPPESDAESTSGSRVFLIPSGDRIGWGSDLPMVFVRWDFGSFESLGNQNDAATDRNLSGTRLYLICNHVF